MRNPRLETKQDDLVGYRILIVEDDYLVASDLSQEMTRLGATVLGPAPDVAHAREITEDKRPDFALLDINLNGEMVFDFATELHSQNIPTIFTTGYDAAFLPPGLQYVPCVQKPVNFKALIGLIRDAGESASRS